MLLCQHVGRRSRSLGYKVVNGKATIDLSKSSYL